jgi:hypothetical protein
VVYERGFDKFAAILRSAEKRLRGGGAEADDDIGL